MFLRICLLAFKTTLVGELNIFLSRHSNFKVDFCRALKVFFEPLKRLSKLRK